MEADGSTCPEGSNSTDCLLRTLLQLVNNNRKADDAKDDWDPVTFGLTLVVGVIAAVFAAIPIIQTVITTGKGGRKASERAIGMWSKKTTKHWSWSTMSFEFTARTPVIQMETLTDWRLDMTMKRADIGPAKPQRNQPQRQDDIAASWLGFFKRTGLEMAIPTKDENLRAVAVEYLPDDLLAAPAYAEVGVIVTAAATAGIQSLTRDKSTGYPILLGRGFQFDFRQHPVLGIVGAYSQYGPISDTATLLTPKRLGFSIGYLLGRVRCESIDKMTFWRLHIVMGGPQMRRQMKSCSQGYMKYHDFFWPGDDGFAGNDLNSHVPTAVLFMASKPEHVPPLFPTSILDGDIPLTLLALNGSYWSDANLDGFGEMESAQEHRLRPSWGSWSKKADIAIIDWFNIREMDDFLSRRRSQNPETDLVRGHDVVLEMSLRLLHDTKTLDGWFQKRSSPILEFLRSLILGEIEEVDRWLSLREPMSQYRVTVLCNTSTLLYNSSKLVKAPERKGSDGSATDHRQPDEADAKSQKSQGTARERHYDVIVALRDLLQEFPLSPELTEEISKLDVEDGSSDPNQIASFSEAVLKRSRDLSLVTNIREVEKETSSIAMAHRMLIRLSAIAYRSDVRYQWLGWRELYKSVEGLEWGWGGLEDVKDLDDVIIYRCLLMNLLFRTALDPTELLQSGLWEQVIPII